MPQVWPITLQSLVNEDGFSHALGETSIRSAMDIGPEKIRRRMTKSVDLFNVSINLTTTQYSVFYNFYDLTLNGGVESFYFNHPITGVQATYRMKGQPAIRSLGGGQFRVSMEWEQLP
jgi:hypothetical protein